MTSEAEGNGARALTDTIEQLIREGNVRRIVVRNDKGQTVLNLPVVVGLVAVLIAPMIAMAGAAIGLVGGWSIDVERDVERDVEPDADRDVGEEPDGTDASPSTQDGEAGEP
ncbi:DUF4342 domain-containing protein [Actinophytocola sediminis]